MSNFHMKIFQEGIVVELSLGICGKKDTAPLRIVSKNEHEWSQNRLLFRSLMELIGKIFLTDIPEIKPFLFAIDATAIRLPIHAQFPRETHPFLPALAEIQIEKRNIVFTAQAVTDFSDDVMFLILAVQKRCCEAGKASLLCCPRRFLQAKSIAEPTAVFLPAGNQAEKSFHVIVIRPDHGEAFFSGISK